VGHNSEISLAMAHAPHVVALGIDARKDETTGNVNVMQPS